MLVLVITKYQVAITKYHRLSNLNNRHLFFIVLEAGKCDIRVPAQLGSARELLPGFQKAVFLLYPHMLERESSGVSSSQHGGSTFMTSSEPNYLSKALPPNTITLLLIVPKYKNVCATLSIPTI